MTGSVRNCSSSENFLTMHLLVSFAFGFEILVGSSTKQTSIGIGGCVIRDTRAL